MCVHAHTHTYVCIYIYIYNFPFQRGALPEDPTENGLAFVPITFDHPLASQMTKVDAVLHKATDEIVNIDLSSRLDFSMKISFSEGMYELDR